MKKGQTIEMIAECPSVLPCEDCSFFKECNEIDVLPEWYAEKRPLGCDIVWDRPTQSFWRGGRQGTQPFGGTQINDLNN